VDPAHGKLYVTERGNNRVLRFAYPLSSYINASAAEAVFGQSDMTGTAANRGGSPAANTLNIPYGLAVGPSGELWVADYNNNRILKFNNAWTAANGVAANTVLGQPGFTTANAGLSETAMEHPTGVSVDAAGNLWVSDLSNQRVLRFASAASKLNGAAADGVLGQSGFYSKTGNRDGIAANGLMHPYGLHASGMTLWVADWGNNRILRFDNAAAQANGAAANGVLGQANFTSALANRGTTVAANSLYGAAGVASDSDGRLYVNDSVNNRVLIYNDAATKANGAPADNYLGTSSFSSPGNLGSPWHLAYDSVNHRLLIGSPGANNVMQFFNAYATSTTLTSDHNPLTTVGATVTFTATVTTTGGGPVASGNVNFKEGATVLGIGALNGAGQASLATSALSDGTHTIFAVLTNTTSHKGSQSTVYTQVVGKYTPTLSLVGSPSPSTVGTPVVFAATVTPPAGAPSPGGTVEFAVDDGVVATVGLSGGTATWTAASLTAGDHAIRAIYSGNVDFRGATNTMNQTVNPAGQYTLVAVANVESDSDGAVYDGNYWGDAAVYAGSYDTVTMVAGFKFDLSGLSGTILSAKLKARLSYVTFDGALSDYNLLLLASEDDSWQDTASPSAPASVITPALAVYSAGSKTNNDWTTTDVTPFVQAQFAGDQRASFVFDTDATTGYNYVGFYSKEGYPTNRPVLEVIMATDVTSPALTSVDVPAAVTYRTGQQLDFTVHFDEAVVVNIGGGTPRIPITLDVGGTIYADYVSGGGSTALIFRYVVAAGHLDTTDISVGDAIQLNGGTLQDAALNNATLTLSSVGSITGVKVDGVAPYVTGITRKTPAAQAVNTSTVVFQVSLSEDVINVTSAWFGITSINGNVTATVASVSGGPQIYDVTVNIIGGAGDFRLDVSNPNLPN
jgi:sugar lactone lactonase YvrE